MRLRLLSAAAALVAALVAAGPAGAVTNAQIPGLQVALKLRGFYRGPVDGVAGPLTARAVRDFQRRAGLQVDGLAGRRTRTALGRLGRPLFGRRDLRRGAVGWDVSVLQFLLARRGCAPPRLNGQLGRGTEAAVILFQAKVHLPADGVVGPMTRAALLGKPVRRPRAAPRRRTLVYRVKAGDTLAAIAARYGSSVRALARANRLRSVNLVLAGSKLKVPIVRSAASSRASRARIRASIDRWAAYYGVDGSLARALAWMESGWQPGVTSSVGAWGVMQVTPETWSFVESVLIGFPMARTADGNVRVGVAYLRHLLREFHGNERLALGAYYQGPWSVRRQGLLAVSREFVADVQALKARM